MRSVRDLGRSVDGRPIELWRFRGRGPAVLLFGAIHGDEPLGVHCLHRLADELDAAPPERDVWIVPVVNPDGLAAGQKNNARGVDLNRNWPAKNWVAEHQPRYHPGAAPLSEPETQLLHAVIAESGARRLIALHSPFRVVNWDGAGRALAERMGALNGYGASGDIGYPTPGSFGSYYGVDLGYEVITLEIPLLTEQEAWSQNRAALLETLRIA